MDLLESLARPAAPRELALSAWAQIAAAPHRAGPILKATQRDARRIRSRQRRPLMEVLFDLVRHARRMEWKLGTDDPQTLWIGMLIRHGLDPATATAISGIDGPWDRLDDWDTPHPDPLRWLALRGGISDEATPLVHDSLGDRAHPFFDASDQRAPLCIRANPAKATRTQLQHALAERSIASEPGPWSTHGLVLHGRPQLDPLDLHRDGWFEVQDEGSQLLAELVQAQGTVVDLCAGAGGKTLAMATGARTLHAADVRHRALTRLKQRARRAGVRVTPHALPPDGVLPRSLSSVRADRVLVDAPCSGMGVLRRDPHNRLRLNPSDLTQLCDLQARILDRAATLVKPGGRLIYATCSVLRPENDDAVSAFLQRHPHFRLHPADEVMRADVCDGAFLRVAPDTHGTDGFFGAVLVRQPPET